jgi:hypothetical protein
MLILAVCTLDVIAYVDMIGYTMVSAAIVVELIYQVSGSSCSLNR